MRLLLAATAWILVWQPGAASAFEPYVAEVRTFAFRFCPRGHAGMHGQSLSLSQNTALFSLLGTRYGGNGTNNFALPAAKPVYTVTGANLIQCMALQGVFPPRP
jgi:microcystin-dependent protein